MAQQRVATQPCGRLIIVSNRSPYRVEAVVDGRPRLRRTVGGVVTALEPLLRERGGLWVAWHPDGLTGCTDRSGEIPFELAAVHLRPWEAKNYYYGFANRALWPIAHSLPSRAQIRERHWRAYRRVNRKFAREVLRWGRPGDSIWVNDYQLARVPLEIRARSSEARVGFFWHIPFPSPEVFRRIPWAPEIVKGMLGADLIGFHTRDYVENFLEAVSEVPDTVVDMDEGRVQWRDRCIRVGAFPIGVDFPRLERRAQRPEIRERALGLRRELAAEVLALGVDRIDYTKGIPERMLAVERMLAEEPGMIGRFVLAQIAVPSRARIREYRVIRREIEGIVDRVNARFSRGQYSPIRYLPQEVPADDLVAYYVASDVALVTPLRDGMNLVAKEYAACRDREDGALVLSRFAGAAEELTDAYLVDPKDVPGMARTILWAIRDEPAERSRRMRAIRSRVRENDLQRWVSSFLAAFPGVAEAPRSVALPGFSSVGLRS